LTEANKNSENTKKPILLVVEDEEINFLYIEAVVEEKYRDAISIIHAKNGQEAIDFCVKNNDIKLVLMDIRMPIVNGLDATKTIKQTKPDMPIIIQTAYSSSDDKKKALAAGGDAFISKPIDSAMLQKLIDNFIKLHDKTTH
jgi:CheY-like chemotaxis protein